MVRDRDRRSREQVTKKTELGWKKGSKKKKKRKEKRELFPLYNQVIGWEN